MSDTLSEIAAYRARRAAVHGADKEAFVTMMDLTAYAHEYGLAWVVDALIAAAPERVLEILRVEESARLEHQATLAARDAQVAAFRRREDDESRRAAEERSAEWSAAYDGFGREASAAWLAEVASGGRVAQPDLTDATTAYAELDPEGALQNVARQVGDVLTGRAREAVAFMQPDSWDIWEDLPADRDQWLAALDGRFGTPKIVRVTGEAAVIAGLTRRASAG